MLAAVWDVNAVLGRDDVKAIAAARKQCAVLLSGAPNPDHQAAVHFSYDGVTPTDEDGWHLNYGLRNTLCPGT